MRRLLILAIVFTVANAAILTADEASTGPDRQEAPSDVSEGESRPSAPAAGSGDSPIQNLFPRFRGRAVVMEINARVVEQNQNVVWDESHTKATIPGRPVGIKLVGANVVVAVQFTPYIRRTEKILVAQGQIWMEIPEQGIRYHTSMQTIPVEFGEPIFFFPLGPIKENDSASIEVMLTMHPYEEN